jgi:hypothetical protein
VLDLDTQGGWCTQTNRSVLCGQIILLAPVMVRRTLLLHVPEIHDLLIFKYVVYVADVGSRSGIEFAHPSGAYSFEVARRFSVNLCTPLPSVMIFCV